MRGKGCWLEEVAGVGWGGDRMIREGERGKYFSPSALVGAPCYSPAQRPELH